MGTLLSWDGDRSEILDRIAGRRADCKILLKTRNEAFFLERWIAHHGAIVGLENLIIADNMSSDPSVLETLHRVSAQATVFQFSGFHNHIHRVERFAPLYAAVRAAADFYGLIDTDEFLVWIDAEGRVWRGEHVRAFLRGVRAGDLVIASWLENYTGSASRFILFEGGSRWPVGLPLGKSLVASRAEVRGSLCHNFQLDGPDIGTAVSANLFLLHMKRLSPDQRIRANVEKLRQYRYLRGEEGVEKVLSADWSALPPGNPRQWIKEVQALWAKPRGPRAEGPLRSGLVRITPDDSLEFHSEADRSRFRAFLQDPVPLLVAAFEARADRASIPGLRRRPASG